MGEPRGVGGPCPPTPHKQWMSLELPTTRTRKKKKEEKKRKKKE